MSPNAIKCWKLSSQLTKDANTMQLIYQDLTIHISKWMPKAITITKLVMLLTYHLYELLFIIFWKVKYNYTKCMMVSTFSTKHTLSHELFSTEFFLWWDLSHLISAFCYWAANFTQLIFSTNLGCYELALCHYAAKISSKILNGEKLS